MGDTTTSASHSPETKHKSLPLLPQDIITDEILIRLPVKSLVKLRCVCKSWNLLSRDRDFVKSHLTRRTCMEQYNCNIIVKVMPDINTHKFGLRYPSDLYIAGSVNGLVCVFHLKPGTGIALSIGIWNPATHQYRTIPCPSKKLDIPGRLHSTIRFGYDPITDDYKVMWVGMSTDRQLPLVAHVYSCNACCWFYDSVTSTFVLGGRVYSYSGKTIILVHGHSYWYCWDAEHYYLVSFDTQHEVLRLLPDIEDVKVHAKYRLLVNLRDSLAIMIDNYRTNTTLKSVDVYIFDERCGYWSKNYTIGSIPFDMSFFGMSLFDCFNNGDLLLKGYQLFKGYECFKVLTISNEAHGISRLGSHIYDHKIPYSPYTSLYRYGYKESLVSVKGMKSMHFSNVNSEVFYISKGTRTVRSTGSWLYILMLTIIGCVCITCFIFRS